MPYTTHNGLNIYYQTEGSGPDVLLVHGLGASVHTWLDNGYVAALRDNYRVILLELPGHGRSDKLHQREPYERANLVRAILAVLDAAGARQPVYWGYSFGATLGYAMAVLAGERFRAFVLGGSHPYQGDTAATEQRIALFRQGGINAYVAAIERDGLLVGERRQRVLNTDVEALAYALEAMAVYRDQPEALASLTMPVLFYVGENDGSYPGMQQAAAALSHSELAVLPGLNHNQASVRADMVLPHVLPFLERVVQRAASSA